AMAALAAEPEAQGREAHSRDAAQFIHAFDRAARAVRLCSMLEARFEADLARPADASALSVDEAPREPLRPERTPREVRRDDRNDCVGQPIGASLADDGERNMNLRWAALEEKLDREWDDARYLDRPIGVVLKDLCADLGLDPDWTDFENEDFAIAEALART